MKIDPMAAWELQARPRGGSPKIGDAALRAQSSPESTRKVAEEFASLLLTEMLKAMRATLSGEGLDGEKSSARDMYAALADGEVTRVLSKHDGMGLASFLERSLGRLEPQVSAQESSSVVGKKEGS